MASFWPPKKNAAFDLYVALRDADGDPITGATGLDSERSLDGAAFADCTNEATEIGTTGIYKLALTNTEMNTDVTIVQIKSTSTGYKTVVITLYTAESTWDEGIDVKAALTGAITSASFAAGAINAAAIATDAIDADALSTDAITEIWAKAMSDLAAGTPSPTASVLFALNLLYELAINRITQTATTTTLFKADGTTPLMTAAVSDNGTTLDRSEFV